MKLRKLGADGPVVHAVGLGCMSFAGFFGATDQAASLRCLAAAVDRGIDFWDTSNVYGAGLSETVIGAFLRQSPVDVKIATKAGIVNGPQRRFDNSAEHLRTELEGSLKRLGVERVELFYIHRREAARPVEEVVETLARLVADGKIGGYGLSEVSPATLRRAHAVFPCRAVQSEYSLWSRQPELGLLQACAELGVGFVPFSPLGRGVFSESFPNPSAMAETDFRRNIPRFQDPHLAYNQAIIARLRHFAQARGWTTSALALAWVLDQGPYLIPIPGTRTADHLAEWAGAADIAFTPEDRAEIARLMPVGWASGDRYNDAQAVSVERYC